MGRNPAAEKVKTDLKRRREQRGVSAADLADTVGISRQTVYAIEDGCYVPNTTVALRLARALGIRVEELFRLDEEEPIETSREVRAVLLGEWRESDGRLAQVCRIGEQVIAVPAPVRSPHFPSANGRIVERAKMRLAGQKASIQIAGEELKTSGKHLVIAGCDPALSLLAETLGAAGVQTITAPCGSGKALRWLRDGLVHVAGSHLLDRKTGEYNLPALRRLFPRERIEVLTFARWEQGLVVKAGNPKRLRGIGDLAGRDVSLINREQGAGCRELLDAGLRQAGIEAADVNGYERLAAGHLAAAASVASEEADCCIASQSAALVFGLDFVPLEEERFELCLSSNSLPAPATRTLMDVLNSSALRLRLHRWGGYDTTETGNVRHS